MDDQHSLRQSLQLYNLEHNISKLTLSVTSKHITSLVKISDQFLPPRQSTSLPACNNVFYSCFPTTKKHRGQRGTALCRVALLSAGTINKTLWTSQSPCWGWKVLLTWKTGTCRKSALEAPSFPIASLNKHSEESSPS